MYKYWGTFLLLSIFISCKQVKTDKDVNNVEDIVISNELTTDKQYGFNLEDFLVVRDTVKRGDSFGELMIQNKVDYPKIAKVSEEYRDTFDVRKIRVGKPYLILKSKDTTEAAQVFIYQ
ncbi:MAG: M23 family peptidase, partial [Eudoraea sp.]